MRPGSEARPISRDWKQVMALALPLLLWPCSHLFCASVSLLVKGRSLSRPSPKALSSLALGSCAVLHLQPPLPRGEKLQSTRTGLVCGAPERHQLPTLWSRLTGLNVDQVPETIVAASHM